MKSQYAWLKPFALVVGALVCCALHLPAQTAPTITTPPASQTNLAGTTATFGVTFAGTGPFTYQWQFNGTNLPNNIITTVAGNGGGTFAGDGGAATNASLSSPQGLGFDASGNMYIADNGNSRVRKVGASGIITTFAGNGNGTYGGDGGTATNAGLSPSGVAFDAIGNLYIADAGNNRIRMVDTNGIINTVAGNGGGTFAGDGGAATSASLSSPIDVALDASGDLYIADQDNHRIREVGTNGIITTVAGGGNGDDGGAATNASLNLPYGVALDGSGNLYFADYFDARIRRVGTNGIITSVAGKAGSGGYSGDGGAATNALLSLPTGVALDAFGDLYIADQDNNRIRRVATNGIITTVAGTGTASYSGDGGAATSARLNHPFSVAVDASGNLYLSDSSNNRVRKVSLYAGYPTLTLANVGAGNSGSYAVVISNSYGSVTSMVATLTVLLPAAITTQPVSQAVLNGSNATLSVTATGTPVFYYSWYLAGTNLVQSGTSSALTLSSVGTNNAGNYTVVVTNAYGSVTSQVATLTVVFPPSVMIPPASEAVLAGGNATFSVTPGGTGPFSYQWQFNGAGCTTNIITTVAGNGTGTYGGDGGAATNAGLPFPLGVVLDTAGNLYIAAYNMVIAGSARVRKVDTNGVITTVAGTGTASYSGDGGPATSANLGPYGLAFDSVGNLYIADAPNQRIRKVSTNGVITTVAGTGTASYSGDGGVATSATLWAPEGVALDAFGNLYIADLDNQRIRMMGLNGIITTVAGKGGTASYSGDGGAATIAGLSYPNSVALDAIGDLYIADSRNNRIRKVGINGIITTVAGNNSFPGSGDGGAATNAGLDSPFGLALDAFGNLYIADQSDNLIRKVDNNGIITTVAGKGGNATYSGDGGAATNAGLHSPSGVAIDAFGNLYIADTGNSRIREVQLTGYPTFAVTNLSVTNSGNYSVVITSPYGSVTSAVAALTVAMSPPQIVTTDGSFGFLSNQFGFNVSAPAGLTIVVDGSTNLVNWTPLFTNTATGSPFYFSDPAWANFPGRYYRARLP